MIRNLKILGLAALALAAFGAFSASGAQAASFHCSVEPCKFKLKPDETAGTKTAHHVYVVKNAAGESTSFTCQQLTGEGTSNTKTTETLTATGLAYDSCLDPINRKVTVDFNGCDYLFGANGGGTDKAPVTVVCPAGKSIEVTVEGGCVVKVGPQALTGIGYHNKGTAPNREATVTAAVPNIGVSVTGTTAQCGIDPSKTPITSEYTTGNTLVQAETHAGVKVDGWWE